MLMDSNSLENPRSTTTVNYSSPQNERNPINVDRLPPSNKSRRLDYPQRKHKLKSDVFSISVGFVQTDRSDTSQSSKDKVQSSRHTWLFLPFLSSVLGFFNGL